jgi:CheY-like chemotaxis protein
MSETTKNNNVPNVLLVEDNENDVLLTRRSFAKCGLAANLHHVENGEQCMHFLRKQGEYTNAPTPDLILLDLNMPLMDGREVLAEMVVDKSLNHLPVIILTTSDSDRDILGMYKLRCNSYITKPVNYHDFLKVIDNIGTYWFDTVTLPTKH